MVTPILHASAIAMQHTLRVGYVYGGHVRNYFVFNIIIFGSRYGIIETACLTCRESVTITLKSYNMLLLLLSSDTAYQAQGCSVVPHVVESTDKTIM